MIRALETCPFPELPIEIRTDSQYTIACESSRISLVHSKTKSPINHTANSWSLPSVQAKHDLQSHSSNHATPRYSYQPLTHLLGMTTYLTKWLQNNFLTSGSGSASYGKFSKKNTGSSSGTTSARTKVKNADLIKHLLVLLRRRGPGNGVRFKYVPGHQGVEGNEGADVGLCYSLFITCPLVTFHLPLSTYSLSALDRFGQVAKGDG